MSTPSPSEPDDGTSRWPLWPVVGMVVLAWAALAWPWLSGAVTIPWDAKAHFHPQLQFLASSLHKGLSPFWAPFVFAGTPQVADPQSLIFSPSYLLMALATATPGFQASDGAVLGTLLAGSLALVLLFKDRGWHPAGAVVTALAFAFGAAAAWRIQHIGQVLSLGYFAITLLFLSRALERGSKAWGLAAGLMAGFMVLGRDQVALLGVYVLTGLVIAAIAMAPKRWVALKMSFWPLIAGALGAILVAVIPILLTAFLAEESNRPAIDLVGAGKGSLHPASLLTAFVANLFGASGPLENFWGPPSPAWNAAFGPVDLYLARNMSQLYLGLIPVLMVLGIGLARRALFRREIIAMTVATLLVLIYMLGRYTPGFAPMFEYLPGLSFYRRPADALFLFGALLAILGGYLTHLFLTDTSRRPQFVPTVLTLLVVLAAGVASLLLAQAVGRLSLAIIPVVTALLCLLLSTGALLAARGLAQQGATLAACMVLAATLTIDLAVNNGPSESTALPSVQYDVLRADSRNDTIAVLKRETARTNGPDRRDRVELAGIGFHWPNASLVHGLDNTLGYNPLRLGDYSKATGAGDHVALPDQRTFSALMPSYVSPLAHMLGLRFIATGVPIEQIDKTLRPGALKLVARTTEAYIYENPAALPRVQVLTEGRKADFGAILSSGTWPAFDPAREVLLEREMPPLPTGALTAATARILSYGTTRVSIETDAPRGGVLVLNDAWQRWWTVEVDGKPAELLKANLIFRGVMVPPGKARVDFVFRPFSGLFRDIGQRLRGVQPAKAT